MIKQILPCLLLTGILWSTSSCMDVKEPDLQGIEDLRVSKLGLSESTLFLNLQYLNPNPYGIKLKSAEGDAWIENNYLGHFTVDTLVQAPARGTFSLPVKLQVDMSKLLKNSLVSLLNPEVNIKVDGKARVGKGFIYINYPVRYEGKQRLDKLLK